MLVDVHTHILPGIDDGAQDLQTAEAMLKLLAADGVTDVVLTPHFYFRNQNMAAFLEKRRAAYESLAARNVGGIKLHLGAEVEFSNVSIDYSLFRKLTIDGGKYILLELPYRGSLEKDILPKLDRFVYQTGLRPIIAHVERYQGISDQPGLAAELIDMGCLLQVNGEAVLDCRHGSLVDALFQRGQVHLMGTDCHNIGSRKPELKRALDWVAGQYGQECRRYLTEIAGCVAEGRRVQVSSNGRIRKFLGKYR